MATYKKRPAYVVGGVAAIVLAALAVFFTETDPCSLKKMQSRREDEFISQTIDRCLACAAANTGSRAESCKQVVIDAVRWLESDPDGYRTVHNMPYNPSGSQLAANCYARIAKLSSDHGRGGVFQEIFLAVRPDKNADPVGLEAWISWGEYFQVIDSSDSPPGVDLYEFNITDP